MGVNKFEIRRIVENYVKTTNQTEIFKNGSPGKKWLKLFMKRWNKDLSLRTPQNLPKSRAIAVSQECIDEFFSMVEKKFISLEATFGPIPASSIFNCDEIGFSTSQGENKIVCRRGMKNPCANVADVDKAYYTVNYCYNAKGEFLPPYIIYKSINLYDSWCRNGPSGTGYNTSKSGWMEERTFNDWFNSFFLNHKPDGPVVLFFDNHSSHVTLPLIRQAILNNVHIIFIPPHTSHVFQPLDVAAFKPFKSNWKKIVHDYYINNSLQNIDKQNFQH